MKDISLKAVSDLRKPEAILFDMDGILVDSEALHWDSVLDVLRDHLGEEAPQLTQRVGWGDEELWRELNEHYQLNKDPLDLMAERGQKAMKALWERPPPPIQGALEAIHAWRSASPEIKMAVVSASPKDQMIASLRPFTDSKGLSLFDKIISGVDDVCDNKPAPDAYLKAINHFRLSPDQCWIAEDSNTGLTAALASGAEVFAVRAHFADPKLIEQCRFEMNSLLALHDLWLTLNHNVPARVRKQGTGDYL